MTFNYPTRKDGLFLLRNKDYEDIAEQVLKEYAPYMLKEARELDLEKLADALGLLIDEEYLSVDGSILGANVTFMHLTLLSLINHWAHNEKFSIYVL